MAVYIITFCVGYLIHELIPQELAQAIAVYIVLFVAVLALAALLGRPLFGMWRGKSIARTPNDDLPNEVSEKVRA